MLTPREALEAVRARAGSPRRPCPRPRPRPSSWRSVRHPRRTNPRHRRTPPPPPPPPRPRGPPPLPWLVRIRRGRCWRGRHGPLLAMALREVYCNCLNVLDRCYCLDFWIWNNKPSRRGLLPTMLEVPPTRASLLGHVALSLAEWIHVEDFPLGLVGGCPVLGHVFAAAESRTCGEKRARRSLGKTCPSTFGACSFSRVRVRVHVHPSKIARFFEKSTIRTA